MNKGIKWRHELLRTYGSLYKPLEVTDNSLCWYCNMPRSDLDHCPSISKLEYISPDEYINNGIELVLIPCCGRCNKFLSNSSLLTPKDRLNHLYYVYQEKINECGKEWSKEETKEMGKFLRSQIQNNNKKLNSLRISYNGIVDNMLKQ